MTPLLWQRPSQNQAQSRYHATTNGTPICGAQVRVAMTRPRELTGRQIETQGCKVLHQEDQRRSKRMTHIETGRLICSVIAIGLSAFSVGFTTANLIFSHHRKETSK